MADPESVREQLRPEIEQNPHIASAAVRNGRVVLTVNSQAEINRLKNNYGNSIRGVPIVYDLDDVGYVTQHDHGTNNVFRPVPAGVRMTSTDSGLGTSGFVMHDGSGNAYLSTNAHVVGGDSQPAVIQNHTAAENRMGTIAGQEHGAQYNVDLAWVEPTHARINSMLYRLGKAPRGGIYAPSEGDTLTLVCGRTGVKRRDVEDTNAYVSLGGGMNDIIQTGPDSVKPGDSGSPVVFEDSNGFYRPVGLVFAQQNNSNRAYICKQSNIEQASGLKTLLGSPETLEFTETLNLAASPKFDPRTDQQALQNKLTIDGDGRFEFVMASGQVRQHGMDNYSDTITANLPTGGTFWYEGTIEGIYLHSGYANEVYINGEKQHTSDYIKDRSGGGNTAPNAQLTITGKSGRTVEFSGAQSVDEDGHLENYAWAFGDGTTRSGGNLTTVSHTYGSDGEYTTTLTVTDNGGKKETDQRTVSIATDNDPNSPPVANLSLSPDNPTVGDTVELTAVASHDLDGHLVGYRWELPNGTVKTGETATWVPETAGDRTVRLIVEDNGGKTASASTTVPVSGTGSDPPEEDPKEGSGGLVVAMAAFAAAKAFSDD